MGRIDDFRDVIVRRRRQENKDVIVRRRRQENKGAIAGECVIEALLQPETISEEKCPLVLHQAQMLKKILS